MPKDLKDCVSYKSETRIKWSSCNFTWTINGISKFLNFNICTCFTESQPLLSPKFCTESNHDWQLRLFNVQGDWGENDTCKVDLTSDSDIATHDTYQMLDGVNEFGHGRNEILHRETIGPENLTSSVAVDKLNEFLKKFENDELTIYCEINVGTEQTWGQLQLSIVQLRPPWEFSTAIATQLPTRSTATQFPNAEQVQLTCNGN
jgi:hypothetical protein